MILHETIVVAITQDDSPLIWVDFFIDWCCHEHTTSVLVADVCCGGGTTDGVGVDGGDDVAADTITTDGFIAIDVDEDDEDVDNNGGGGEIIVDVDDVDVVDDVMDVDDVVLSVDVLSAAAIVGTFSLPRLICVNDVSGVTDGLSSNCNFLNFNLINIKYLLLDKRKLMSILLIIWNYHILFKVPNLRIYLKFLKKKKIWPKTIGIDFQWEIKICQTCSLLDL